MPRNIALNPHAAMVPLSMDSALTQFRRLVAQAIEAERSPLGVTYPGDALAAAQPRPDIAGDDYGVGANAKSAVASVTVRSTSAD